jgi:hypothetical protein
MKYSVIFTGIVALSSDVITQSNAAILPRNSTTAVAAVESGAASASKGPEFPVAVSLQPKLKAIMSNNNHSSTRERKARTGPL